MDKFLEWLVKIGGVVITAPVTFAVAATLFIEFPVGLRFVMQLSAVALVEGVFMYSWWKLDHDKGDDMAYKWRHVITATMLYFGLWYLALRHGEGFAGIVFRLALGAALAGSIYDTGVYESLRIRRRAERDVMKAPKVRRKARTLAKRDAIVQLESDSEYTRGIIGVRHEARMKALEEAEVVVPDIVVTEPDAPATHPPDATPEPPTPTLNTEQRRNKVVQMVEAKPNITVTELSEALGVSRTTIYNDLEKRGVEL